jgi:hypothetical protein
VEARAPGGRRVVLHPIRGTFFGPLVAANLAAHGRTFLDFATDDGCNGGLTRPTRYRKLTFRLPSGGSVSGGGLTLTVVCGLAMSSFGLQPRYTGTTAAPGSPGSLDARIELPQSVARGATLSYTVTLANPTSRAVALASACPAYTEGLYTQSAQVRGSYRLNCAAAGSLAPNATATFAMELQVPETASPGVAKVGWNLDTPTGPAAGGIVTVTG